MNSDLPTTEQRNPRSSHLGEMSAREVVDLMGAEDVAVLTALETAAGELAAAAERVAETYLAGGRTVLFGSGTSGRLVLQEVAELPPTFGLDPAAISAYCSGPNTLEPVARDEDDADAAVNLVARLGLGSRDTVIGVAASGTTPFACAAVAGANRRGSYTIGIANNDGTPLLTTARLGIHLATGPEVLTGSTRLKAGTAQKIALNRITTAAMVLADRVQSNHMVEVRGTISKLRDRARRIVCDLRGVDADLADAVLAAHDWYAADALRALDAGWTPR